LKKLTKDLLVGFTQSIKSQEFKLADDRNDKPFCIL